MFSTMTDS